MSEKDNVVYLPRRVVTPPAQSRAGFFARHKCGVAMVAATVAAILGHVAIAWTWVLCAVIARRLEERENESYR